MAELEGRINCLEGNHAFEVSYEWATDYFACTATQDCTRTACDVKNEFTATAITVSGTTLTATFDGVANATIDISTIENKDYFIVMGENGNSTYVIYNKAGLDAWRMAATADASTNLTLACDIEYNASWPKLDIVYNGRIEGNGYAIKGMDCLTYRTESYASVTYTTFINELGSNGIIKHLGMAGCTFTNEYNSSNTGSSGFVCENYGIIMGCYNASTCISTADGDDDFGSAAGIAYRNYGLIIACYNVGTISSAAYDDASGISARNLGTISSCYNTGTVSVQDTSSDHYIPCAITSSNYKTIHDCYYTQPSMGYNNYAYPSSSTPTATNITNISGDGWTEAMNAMNAAIEAYNADETNTVKCDYRYAINTDEATGCAQPLVIVAVEAN